MEGLSKIDEEQPRGYPASNISSIDAGCMHHHSRAQQTADRLLSIVRETPASVAPTQLQPALAFAFPASTTPSSTSTSDSSTTCPYSHSIRALRARRSPPSIHRRRQTPSPRVPAHPPSSHPSHNHDSGRHRPPSEPRRPVPPAPAPPSRAPRRSLLAATHLTPAEC